MLEPKTARRILDLVPIVLIILVLGLVGYYYYLHEVQKILWENPIQNKYQLIEVTSRSYTVKKLVLVLAPLPLFSIIIRKIFLSELKIMELTHKSEMLVKTVLPLSKNKFEE